MKENSFRYGLPFITYFLALQMKENSIGYGSPLFLDSSTNDMTFKFDILFSINVLLSNSSTDDGNINSKSPADGCE